MIKEDVNFGTRVIYNKLIHQIYFRNFLKPPKNAQINFNTPDRNGTMLKICDEDEAILGRGSYGTVVRYISNQSSVSHFFSNFKFRAAYKNKTVAVKIIEKSNVMKYQSLRNEANILHLDHDNIIGIIKIVDCKTYGAIIMELFNGICLQSVMDIYKIELIHR